MVLPPYVQCCHPPCKFERSFGNDNDTMTMLLCTCRIISKLKKAKLHTHVLKGIERAFMPKKVLILALHKAMYFCFRNAQRQISSHSAPPPQLTLGIFTPLRGFGFGFAPPPDWTPVTSGSGSGKCDLTVTAASGKGLVRQIYV